MSQESVEIVRQFYSAFNCRDWDAMFRDAHQDVEYTFQRAPNPGPHRGRKAVQARMEDALATYGVASYELDDLRERGDHVVALLRVRATPRGSSAEMENHVGHVWTLHDGKVVSVHTYPKREQALEAAGLSE